MRQSANTTRHRFGVVAVKLDAKRLGFGVKPFQTRNTGNGYENSFFNWFVIGPVPAQWAAPKFRPENNYYNHRRKKMALCININESGGFVFLTRRFFLSAMIIKFVTRTKF